MRPRSIVTLLVLAGLMAIPGTASSALRDDADWYQFYFPSSDGVTQLHADVLRPKGTPMTVPQPVILTVSPYTNHSGSTSANDLNGQGPNPRFYDFLDLSGALSKGYTYVMVDLPGDGGSAGCNDWGGAREQAGVRAAVEWAASQPWSNGKVGLIGKSYDGWTGLMGIAQQPKGLAAVASLEPVYSGYRYIWMNGVRRGNTWPYGTTFTQVDAQPGRPSDEPMYHVNGAPQAWCYPINIAGQNLDDSETGPYWAERNLIPTAFGKTTPLFLTQGFLETNTKQDGTFQYWNSLAGHDNHAWFGQFDHCRGWEQQRACTGGSDTRLATGHPGFMDELMRFFDEHLKGIEPEVQDPTVSVQDIDGRWRAEESWPPEDMRMYDTPLRSGTYTDSGSGSGQRPSETQGIWTISQPMEHDAWLAGTPQVNVSVDAAPNANLAANVYDLAPDGKLLMISRGVQLLRGTGVRNFSIELYGQDFPIAAGHRIAVLISSANTDQFEHIATRQTVTVRNGSVSLPFLGINRVEFLESLPTPRLISYLNSGRTTLSTGTITGSQVEFDLPPKLIEPDDEEEEDAPTAA